MYRLIHYQNNRNLQLYYEWIKNKYIFYASSLKGRTFNKFWYIYTFFVCRYCCCCCCRRLRGDMIEVFKITHNIYDSEVSLELGTEPFRSRANSLPGANRPIGLRPIRSLANSLPGPFVPWPFRSLELSLHGPFAPDGQNHYLFMS